MAPVAPHFFVLLEDEEIDFQAHFHQSVMVTTAQQWRESFPDIPWDDPIPVTVMKADGKTVSVLACRICIADQGLKAQDIIGGKEGTAVFAAPDAFFEHLLSAHEEERCQGPRARRPGWLILLSSATPTGRSSPVRRPPTKA